MRAPSRRLHSAFREEIMLILRKLSQKSAESIPSQTLRGGNGHQCLMNRNPCKMLSVQVPQHVKKGAAQGHVAFSPGTQDRLVIHQSASPRPQTAAAAPCQLRGGRRGVGQDSASTPDKTAQKTRKRGAFPEFR